MSSWEIISLLTIEMILWRVGELYQLDIMHSLSGRLRSLACTAKAAKGNGVDAWLG